MAAPATAVTTLHSLGRVREFLGAPSEMDVRIAAVADAVTALIESETGQVFVSRALSDTYDGTGGRVLLLRRYPVASVASLSILRSPEDAAAEVIDAADYRVLGATGRVQLLGGAGVFSVGLGNVAITYTAGFGAQDAATLPADIVDASLELIKLKYDQKAAGAIAASTVSVGPSTFTVRQDIPWHVRRVLDSWMDRKV